MLSCLDAGDAFVCLCVNESMLPSAMREPVKGFDAKGQNALVTICLIRPICVSWSECIHPVNRCRCIMHKCERSKRENKPQDQIGSV
jgi:hypothetical protein